MSTISLRMNEEEGKLIKEFAKAKNVSVSTFIRTSVLEKIEDEIDLKYTQRLWSSTTNTLNLFPLMK